MNQSACGCDVPCMVLLQLIIESQLNAESSPDTMPTGWPKVTPLRLLFARIFNALMATVKPQSNASLYRHTVIGTLAFDGWAVTFGTARMGPGRLRPRPVPSSLYQNNVTAHPSTASAPTSYYSTWHYNCLRMLKC